MEARPPVSQCGAGVRMVRSGGAEEGRDVEYERESKALNFLSGLILGAVIGAGLTILTAPESGRRTRRRLKRAARDIRSQAGDRFDDLSDEVKQRVDHALQGVRDKFS